MADAEVGPVPGAVQGVPLPKRASAAEHYMRVGSSCLDGHVPWTVAQLPKDEGEMIIYALLSGVLLVSYLWMVERVHSLGLC